MLLNRNADGVKLCVQEYEFDLEVQEGAANEDGDEMSE